MHCAGDCGSLALALSSFAAEVHARHDKRILSQAALLSIPCHLELDRGALCQHAAICQRTGVNEDIVASSVPWHKETGMGRCPADHEIRRVI